MTKALKFLVLFWILDAVVSAGPIVTPLDLKGSPAAGELGAGLPPTYPEFMELAGPLWLLGPVAATFDSTMLYAADATATAPAADPLAEPISFVPEPRAVALLAFGLAILFLLGIRRRRRSHSHNL